MSMVTPAAKAAVSLTAFCDAGRRLAHPTRAGWNRPCMEPGDEDFCVTDTGDWLKLCHPHMAELVADGIAH